MFLLAGAVLQRVRTLCAKSKKPLKIVEKSVRKAFLNKPCVKTEFFRSWRRLGVHFGRLGTLLGVPFGVLECSRLLPGDSRATRGTPLGRSRTVLGRLWGVLDARGGSQDRFERFWVDFRCPRDPLGAISHRFWHRFLYQFLSIVASLLSTTCAKEWQTS